MKSGSGDDPFADAPVDDQEEAETETAEQEPDDDSKESMDPSSGESGSASSPEPDSTSDDELLSKDTTPEIPYVLRRSSVKSSRDDVKQFFLRKHVVKGERDLHREVEDLVGKEVSKLDLREAAYVVAQRHAGEIAAELDSWGYEHLE